MKIALLYNKENNFNELAKLIYKTFNRDIKTYLDIGFNIPVFMYDINQEFSIDEDIIISFIDDRFVIKQEKFLELYKKNKDKKKFIFISFTDNYSNIEEIRKLNFIDGTQDNKIIIREILYEIARYFFKTSKVKLFISYKRVDKDNTPIDKLREYIHKNSKIADFFDIYSIEYSEDFEEKIKEEIAPSIFVAFWTDNYTLSEVCKDEVILAKQHNIPIVTINCLQNKDSIAFPYMFNNLVINCNVDFEDTIKEILLEAVRFFNNKNRLENFKTIHSLEQFSTTAKRVEALDLLQYNKVLYPDPPIGKYERALLKGEFITPNEFFSSLNLNKKIAISVSETNDFDNGVSIEHLQDIVVELVRFLLLSANNIIYGGDIRYSLGLNFAEIIFNLAKKYATKKPAVINPLPSEYYKKLDDKIKATYHNIIEFIDLGDDLSKMREAMAKIEDARVIIGGKTTNYKGKYPGVLEEAYYTLKANKPLYIIGAFGGVAKKIAQIKEGIDIKEWQKFDIYETIKKSPLNNGLSEEENRTLFYSKDIDEIIKLLMKGLKNMKGDENEA